MSAQTYPITNQEQALLPQELLFTLDKALHVSKHCGRAWSLTSNNRRICSGAGMVGYPASQLLRQIKTQAGVSELYLSAPLHSGFITLDELLPSLKAVNIRVLNLPSINTSWWIFGEQKNVSVDPEVTINYFPLNEIGNQLYYGPYTLTTKKRPWITCITATTMSGCHVDMQIFKNDFGFKHRTQQRVSSSHALITDNSVDSRPYQGQRNAVGRELLLHKYTSQPRLQEFLASLAKMQLSTAVVIADYDTCMQLLESGLVDELLLSYQLLDSPKTELTQTNQQVLATLPGWEVVDSHLLSLGVQVELLKKPF